MNFEAERALLVVQHEQICVYSSAGDVVVFVGFIYVMLPIRGGKHDIDCRSDFCFGNGVPVFG